MPTIRELTPTDDIDALTDLIRAAYAEKAAAGMRYWATHQSAQETAQRCARGVCLLAELEGRVVGTVTVMPPQPQSKAPLYREPSTYSIGQFAVHPEFKGQGIGQALHAAAMAHAMSEGAQTLALDTAAPAAALIAMYERWGYRIVGQVDWRPHTNYESVLMARGI